MTTSNRVYAVVIAMLVCASYVIFVELSRVLRNYPIRSLPELLFYVRNDISMVYLTINYSVFVQICQ